MFKSSFFMVKSHFFIIFHHFSACLVVFHQFSPIFTNFHHGSCWLVLSFGAPFAPKKARRRPAPRAAPCVAPSCAACARRARRGGRRHTAPATRDDVGFHFGPNLMFFNLCFLIDNYTTSGSRETIASGKRVNVFIWKIIMLLTGKSTISMAIFNSKLLL